MRRLALLVVPLAIACGDKDGPAETGLTDTGEPVDADGDGVFAMDDCDDADPNNFPGNAESCDGADNDCDGEADNGVLLSGFLDNDGDGYGALDQPLEGCEYGINGFVENSEDCDDASAEVNPDAVEVCDDQDNDCDGLVDDDDDSLDIGTTGNWYVDADEDGYGLDGVPVMTCDAPSGTVADNTDCDDDNGAVNPGADEVCDGLDTDCDGSTGEDGMASFIDSSGAVSDVTASVSGTSVSPAAYTVSSEGELAFCDGLFYVNLTIEADADVMGFNGDPTAAILDGGEEAPVITVATDELVVDVSNLTLQKGYGATSTVWGDDAGGGIFCEGTTTGITLGVTGVVFSKNDGGGDGGGLFASLCDATLDDVEFVGNSATFGGAISSNVSTIRLDGVTLDQNDGDFGGAAWIHDSTLDVVDSAFGSNSGEDGGALYLEESDATLESTEVSGNTSESYGAVYCYESSVDWTGTESDSSGVHDNTDDADAAFYLQGCEATFDTVDFGDPDNGDDNSPYDLLLYDTVGDLHLYSAVDDESFTCDEDACGSSTTTIIGGTASGSSSNSYLLARVFQADTDGTIDGFSPYTSQTSSCTTNFYVMSNSTLDGSGWEVLWAETGATVSSGLGYQDSSTVGIPVEAGTWYALAWDQPGCANPYRGGTGSNTSVNDLGEFETGCLYISSSTSTYAQGDTVNTSQGCSSGFQLAMEVQATDL